MFTRKICTAIIAITFFAVINSFGQPLDANWSDFLHYTKIGRFDLAKGYAKALLDSSPEPTALLELSEKNPYDYAILLRVAESSADEELSQLSKEILDIIEQGKYIQRCDPKVIVEEIARLSGTSRGRLAAVKRLQNAGEYAVKYMLDAMMDSSRKEEFANIVSALPQIGKDAIRPLAAALQTEDTGLKAEIIKALGAIGYPQSLAYLKYVVEKDDSAELQQLALQSMKEIDPAALDIASANLFYQLAENYYYHAPSLAPMEKTDMSNMWFWDAEKQQVVWKKVDSRYFNELMAMRSCEWALKANEEFGWAIGLWQAAYFKAEAVGIDMPEYFGPEHADAFVYATTAGPEYLHMALARAIKDMDAYVALGLVEALAATAGEKSLFYRIGAEQPLVQALSFDNDAVKYSAAIAIGEAGPQQAFAENILVVENLVKALGETGEKDNPQLVNKWVSEPYAVRAAKVLLKLAETRNSVIDLSKAQSAVINATKDKRPVVQKLSAQILAYFGSSDAQNAIAVVALDENNAMEVRLNAFGSLAVSAKIHANLLSEEAVDDIYSLVSSEQVEPELRSAAASVYGALNLPSRKVKNLILDQAKS